MKKMYSFFSTLNMSFKPQRAENVVAKKFYRRRIYRKRSTRCSVASF